jgi:hypothetical protein
VVVKDRIIPEIKCDMLGFPFGTRSQFIIYRDGHHEVARAHRYLLPDGQLGASGRPDPKRMLCCGVIFYC